MNKLKDIMKKFNLSKKNAVLLLCALLSVVLLIASEFTGDDTESSKLQENVRISSEEYIEKQEERLKDLLEGIDGAGKVEVMITLESCYENIYLKDSTVKTKTDNDDFSKEEEENYITVKNSSNIEEGVIIKVYEPVVKGVAVVAEGGNNTEIKMAIIETVSAVFNINSANISVEKMKPERME